MRIFQILVSIFIVTASLGIFTILSPDNFDVNAAQSTIHEATIDLSSGLQFVQGTDRRYFLGLTINDQLGLYMDKLGIAPERTDRWSFLVNKTSGESFVGSRVNETDSPSGNIHVYWPDADSDIIIDAGTQASPAGSSLIFAKNKYVAGSPGELVWSITRGTDNSLGFIRQNQIIAPNNPDFRRSSLVLYDNLGTADNSQAAVFYTRNAKELARFNKNGLGIGTFNPTAPLHANLFGYSNGSTTNDILRMGRDIYGSVDFSIGYDEANTRMYLGSKTPHAIAFRIGGNDVGVINALGDVGIGTTAPVTKLDVRGSLKVVSCTGCGYSSSDKRLKQNISSIANPLEKILALRGVSFDWNRQLYPNRNLPQGKELGFIAQEVETTIPEVVSVDDTGFKTVSYQSLVPVLTEAIKQQDKKINDQQMQIDDLKKKLEILLNQK